MNLKKWMVTLGVTAALTGLAGTALATEANASAERDTLWQVSTLQGLVAGDYYGSVPLKELLKHGDTGLGTFDGLNGELIVLDGTCYQALGDGSVRVVTSEKIPFAAVSFLDADKSVTYKEVPDKAALLEKLNQEVREMGSNNFYVCRLDGTFTTMTVRSEYAQKPPYKPLDVVMDTDQTVFHYQNLKGTVVGVYCPQFAAGVNTPGWHMHFISTDRKYGGHVLELGTGSVMLTLDKTDSLYITLPQGEFFQGIDPSQVDKSRVDKVEQGGTQ